MRRLAVVIAGLLLVAGPAASQRISIGLGLGLTFVGGVAGPIDPIGAPASAAYSFRLLRQGYLGTGAAVRLRRASDNAESDIGFSGSGDFDTASATTFCNATSCFVRTWYDQSGNARNMTQATAANQPAFIFNCQGALPCARSTAAAMRLATAAFTPQAIGTYTGVARRSTGTSQINYILVAGGANNNIYIDSVANKWVNGATGNISTTAATEGAFHTGIAVMNGAGAVLNVDGVETTGTVTGGTSAGVIQMLIGGAGTTFDEAEAILWDGYALTAGERTALTANQQKYWMPAPLDTFAPPAAAYSFRRLASSYTANKAVQLRRASDNAVLDIGFTAAGDFDTAAATTHCAATSCFLAKWYDQSGAGRDIVQATFGSQPALVFNCQGTLPCARVTTGGMATAANVTPAAILSASAVVNESVAGSAGSCIWLKMGVNSLGEAATADTFTLWNGSAGLNQTATRLAWHAVVGVANGASAATRVDAAETAGTLSAAATAGPVQINGGTGTTCDFAEMVWWDNYALTAAERAALTANQQQYWMPYALDAFSPPAAAYSFRRLKSTYTANKAVQLRRASDNAVLDIGFTAAGDFDTAAATTHCNATSCFLAAWYDQSGNGRNQTQGGAVNQPSLVFACVGVNPCARFTSNTIALFGPVVTPATGVLSINAVDKRGAGTGFCVVFAENGTSGNRLNNNSSPGFILSGGTSGSISAGGTEGNWHAVNGIINAASSVLGVDGAETTGTATGNTAGTNSTIQGQPSTTCDQTETIVWDNYALTAAERAALTANQRAYFGF